MSKTWAEWEEYFESLPTDKLETYAKAIELLYADKEFKVHFSELGLLHTLSVVMRKVLDGREDRR